MMRINIEPGLNPAPINRPHGDHHQKRHNPQTPEHHYGGRPRPRRNRQSNRHCDEQSTWKQEQDTPQTKRLTMSSSAILTITLIHKQVKVVVITQIANTEV